jgi:hypothetical protein
MTTNTETKVNTPKNYISIAPKTVKAIKWNNKDSSLGIIPDGSDYKIDCFGEQVTLSPGDYILFNHRNVATKVLSEKDFEAIYEIDPNAKVRYRTFRTEISSSKQGITVAATDKTGDDTLLIAFAFGSGSWNKIIDKSVIKETALLRLNSGTYDYSEPTKKVLNLSMKPISYADNNEQTNIPVNVIRRGLYSINLQEKSVEISISRVLKELAKYEADRLGISWRSKMQ